MIYFSVSPGVELQRRNPILCCLRCSRAIQEALLLLEPKNICYVDKSLSTFESKFNSENSVARGNYS